MSGSDNLELSETHTQVELLVDELKTAFEQVVVHDDDTQSIPPIYVCMSICDDLRDLGPMAKSSIPQLLTLLDVNAKCDDQHLLHLRAAHAHFAITDEPGICLGIAMRILDLVSRKRFSEDSPSDCDDVFWLRAWACDILGEMGAVAFRALERLKRLAGEERCTLVRESARRAIYQIENNQSSAVK